jgi:hypothetical protein
VRFSIDEEVVIVEGASLRSDSSGVRVAGVVSDPAGAPPNSVVATDEALYGASFGQWTLVCGSCGE